MSGTIIYLNGASSAGKTTLAQALQRVLDQPYFHLSIDGFGALVLRRLDAGPAFAGDVVGPQINRAFVDCIATLAATGKT